MHKFHVVVQRCEGAIRIYTRCHRKQRDMPDMGLDPKCLSVNATARMLRPVRSILAHRWSIDFWISCVLKPHVLLHMSICLLCIRAVHFALGLSALHCSC